MRKLEKKTAETNYISISLGPKTTVQDPNSMQQNCLLHFFSFVPMISLVYGDTVPKIVDFPVRET